MTTTIMGCGAFPETDPLSLRWLGMHGAAYANWAVNGEYEYRQNPTDAMRQIAPGADLLLAFGVRFDDRVTGKVEKFCETGTIVHLDIDPSEINKNKPANLPIVSDIKYALHRLAEMIKERPIQKDFTAWHKQIADWKAKAPFGYTITEEVIKSQHMKDHLRAARAKSSCRKWPSRCSMNFQRAKPSSPPAWASTRCGPGNSINSSTRANS